MILLHYIINILLCYNRKKDLCPIYHWQRFSI